ncbi:MAG: hypothetical protein PHQ90_04760 [Sulfuricurvum sp.]|nr:hypothetical protein [Sulfuricurvum sp.]MDD2949969.1 hypothetical protein [Sulfuricurvum sp.]
MFYLLESDVMSVETSVMEVEQRALVDGLCHNRHKFIIKGSSTTKRG